MTAPHHAFYIRAVPNVIDTIHQVLLDHHLDEVWLRIVGLHSVSWEDEACIQLELYHLREGMPMLPDSLGAALSEKMKYALRFSADSARTSVAYEFFHEGKSEAAWAGNIETYTSQTDTVEESVQPPSAESDSTDHSETDHSEAFQKDFYAATGLYFCQLIHACAINPKACDQAIEGTELLIRGRFLHLVPGMGRWPEMFRFHDREAYGGGNKIKNQDHLAIVGFDPNVMSRLWRRMPARQVYQYLRFLEPMKTTVLGPMSHALSDVLESVKSYPPEAPLVGVKEPDINLLEMLAMAAGLVYMVGDRVSYLDNCFFPLLSLAEMANPQAAISGHLQDIESLDVLFAMTEVLPYSVPEGEIMEAFDDEELAPLAPWAAQENGEYEGSLFLLNPQRLHQLISDFEIDDLKNKIRVFQKVWYEAKSNPEESWEQWIEARKDKDSMALSRFEDTFVELQHVLALADINQLSLALIFYSE